MADLYLRARVVPPDGVNDVRLYADGADPPVVGGSLLRTLMGVGLSLVLVLL